MPFVLRTGQFVVNLPKVFSVSVQNFGIPTALNCSSALRLGGPPCHQFYVVHVVHDMRVCTPQGLPTHACLCWNSLLSCTSTSIDARTEWLAATYSTTLT